MAERPDPSASRRPVGDLRVDDHAGTRTYAVASRQDRPNLPSTGCPFCPGGIEAPEPYDVRWFTNRWPAMPDDRCEVVLYTPVHDATFWQLGVAGARLVVDLWADRSAALGARDDVDYVLVFENRGAEVGATISHPHGQIYAFDFVPDLPQRELALGAPSEERKELLVARAAGWTARIPHAAAYPVSLRLTPDAAVSDLPSLDEGGREGLAAVLVDVLRRMDLLFGAPAPYMLWIHQRPFDGGEWPTARLHVEIVSPWRATGVMRFIAAGEIGSGVFFNPVPPEETARRLREVPDPVEARNRPGRES